MYPERSFRKESLVLGGRDGRANVVERGLQIAAQRLKGRDEANGDDGGDKAIFDSSCAGTRRERNA